MSCFRLCLLSLPFRTVPIVGGFVVTRVRQTMPNGMNLVALDGYSWHCFFVDGVNTLALWIVRLLEATTLERSVAVEPYDMVKDRSGEADMGRILTQ